MCTEQGRLVLTLTAKIQGKAKKRNSGELEGYLRGVETDSELAREAWGGTLAERSVRGYGEWRLVLF